ncbi:hypothetical protein KEQ84_22240, partial [Escherichia coli]|nr:hypothetical protein [Escherichia coli]
TEKYTAIADLGKSAASGSVMKIAQFASRYQYDPELARGMYLYEHRRCYDNIIGYCNTLCYHGKLLPKRGREESNLMPAMGYLHIDGKGELASSGSRYNLLEAETIAVWLAENQQNIEAHYGKSLHEVVGIVTPFSAQVSTIKQALGKQGISTGANEKSLTVGTVHSLQGAERAIVIFSPVYSKHEDGGFIDSDNSMLNVAVSRAKDSFLVFGDMDLFEIQPPSSPRGLLAKYLFESEKNALSFDYKERKDLKTSETKIYTLHGVEQHDNFLNQTFENTDKHITIVSPWLTWQKLEQTGFLDSMIAACSRGINVTIVTDRSYNTEHKDFEKRKEKQQNLKAALEKLNALGIATKLVNRVHSKIVIGDDGLLCVGSFNWFSATREARYERYDTSSFSQADELADTQIRFPAFLLTTHYWEGRWLMDMASIDDLQEEKKKKGAKGVTARWQRRMKLTPCVVMTCYMLPGNMQISEHKGQRKFEKSYLYDFADLLIVDEAGQVLPEVAAASFALAKKALVIGDTEQLPPIWSIAPAIDVGNMLAEKILSGSTQEEITEKYTAIADLGKSAASGSVMKIAQFASRYQYDPELARGMYLYEHRRCYDNIIGYCNTLCYHGKLLPKRGREESNLMPAMGYLHIDGKGELASSGSRYNLLEAETIAVWLAENQQNIEAHYGKSLHEVVGIVTPFSAQVSTIKQALGKQGISTGANEKSLTVGTVHSLQGAERAIVIFSPVYSKHEDGGFIDSDNSMLNVAVSRAKDSFLVFGDMDLFEIQPPSSARGLLAKYLFESEKNALTFDYKERKDLKTSETKIYTLHGVEQHDNFLNQTFENTDKHITIVSPWLTWQKLEQTGFLDSMIAACSRGINVTIVTDRSYNTEHKDFEKRKEKQQNLKAALEKLNALGIATKLVNRVHSKIVIGDDGLLCVGSFNWFSATREARYERYDTSMVYSGDNLKGEIEAIYNSLERRQV